MSDYPMLISNKLHSFRNFPEQNYKKMFGNRELFRGVNNKKDCYFCYTP